jgi:hypothetical protein
MATGPLQSYPTLSHTIVDGDIGETVTLAMAGAAGPGTGPEFYSPTQSQGEPTGSYEVITLQFLTAPADAAAGTVFLNGFPVGTISGSSSFGPQGLNQGDRIKITVPGATAGDVGEVISVAVTGYWQDSKPDPWPVAISGGLGAPPTSSGGGGGGIELVQIVNPVDDDGYVETTIGIVPVATPPALTNVGVTAASFEVRPANAARRGLIIVNDQIGAGTATVYVKYGTPASATSYTVPLVPGAYWEMPTPVYTGRLDGFGTAATGQLRVTESE